VVEGEKNLHKIFSFPPFAAAELYCPYHEQLVEFLAQTLQKTDARPERMLEIGSSLGRTYFEVCRRIKSIKTATLVEPSQNLFTGFQNIFANAGPSRFSVLKGNNELTEVTLDSASIRAACAAVQLECINQSFQEWDGTQAQFDLVICSGVIDQCHDPLKLVELIKNSVIPGGIVLLACTYQWQDRYLGNAGVQIMDIGELFDSKWRHLGATDIPFFSRINERHWSKFLSHLGIFQLT